MKQKVKSVLEQSMVCQVLRKFENFLADFFLSGSIGQWFLKEKQKPRPIDRGINRFLDSKFCEFVRSGKIFPLLLAIPEIAWGSMMLTALAATVAPTLIVMVLSLVTLLLTFLSVVFRKKRVPIVPNAMIFWGLWFLITAVYTVIGYGDSKGMLAGGIRLVMLPLLPCAWILIDSQKSVRRTVAVFCGGADAVALYGLYQYFFQTLSAKWTDTELFSETLGRLTSTFENPNIYGEFLLMVFPLALVMALSVRSVRQRIFYIVTALLTGINFALTYSRGCYVAMAVILMILLCYKGRYWIWPGVAALVFSPLYLPQSVVGRILSIGNLSDTSVSYRLNIYKGCFKMLSKYWWMGVGIGDSAFRSVYEIYALKAVEDAPHAHNLILQTMCESGVIGLAVLICLFVCIFRTALTRAKQTKNTVDRLIRVTLSAVWIGLLLQSMTDYIFYNNNLFAIMMISLGALLCTGKEVQNEQ